MKKLLTPLFASLLLASCASPEAGAFQKAQSQNTREAYTGFLSLYPDSRDAAKAKARLEEIAQQSRRDKQTAESEAWRSLQNRTAQLRPGTSQAEVESRLQVFLCSSTTPIRLTSRSFGSSYGLAWSYFTLNVGAKSMSYKFTNGLFTDAVSN